ncbi:GGDEF domain-containing protein [Gordonia shandongensis]|uniref:GGDEF domain-containing protein n=1 Tax=Gordonia shandongensis TaxID=376351 RepID=UPI0003F8FBFC|nr:GGDEF domain-containing protein [Gordonia shandongensis]
MSGLSAAVVRRLLPESPPPLSAADEREFRADFAASARIYRTEMWLILAASAVLLLAGIRISGIEIPPDLDRYRPLFLIGLAIPFIVRWASTLGGRLARWSTPLFIASVYIDVVVLMTARVAGLRTGVDLIPLVVPVAFLLSLVVVQIRFPVLVSSMVIGFAAIAGIEIIATPPGTAAMIDLLASSVIVFVPAVNVFEYERSLRTVWSAERRLGRVTRTDALTGLPNRRRLDEVLAAGVASGLPVAVAFLDVDHFKHYNDRFGHPAGDACLAKVGARLAAATAGRPTEFVARVAGEEFVIVWVGDDEATVLRRADEVRAAVGTLDDALAPVTASAGLAFLDVAGRDVAGGVRDLMTTADDALYRAKQTGRDRLVVAEPASDAATAPAADSPAADSSAADSSAADSSAAPASGTGIAPSTPAGRAFRADPRTMHTTPASIGFTDGESERRFRASYEVRGLPSRRLIMAGTAAIVTLIFLGQRWPLGLPDEAVGIGRIVIVAGMLPAALVGLAGTVSVRLRRLSTPLFIGAVAVIVAAQMVERLYLLPKGIDVVPMIWPIALLLGMSLVCIRYSVLLPAMLGLLGAVIVADAVVLPLTSVNLQTYATMLSMAAVTLRFAYREELSARLLWQHTDRLDAASRIDALTGILNRRSFDRHLREWLGDGGAAVAIIDVDHFKEYNDRHGHLAGDACLRQVASVIADYAGDDAFAARLGGEEFALVLRYRPGDTDADRTAIVDAMHAAVARRTPVTVSVGLAITHPRTVPAAGGTATGATATGATGAVDAAAHDLLSRADVALYRAKNGGRDRIVRDRVPV